MLMSEHGNTPAREPLSEGFDLSIGCLKIITNIDDEENRLVSR